MYAFPYFSCMDQDGSDFDFFDKGFSDAEADSFKPISDESDKLSEGRLNYKELSSNIQGRHLLLLSLLDEVHKPYWFPRSGGFIQLSLPPSLAPSDQPAPVASGQLLSEIRTDDGDEMTRKQVIQIFNEVEDFTMMTGTVFSRLKKTHTFVVKSLVGFTTELDFDSMFSLMVVLKEFLKEDMFVDYVYSVIQLREDVGMVIPSLVTVNPEDFLPSGLMEEIDLKRRNSSDGGRVKRTLRNWARGGELEIDWNQEKYWTLHESEPDSKLWYFNEDPLINSNHFHWHQLLSNSEQLGHTSHSSNLDRRGEMFYFIHKQILSRVNAERLSVGLNITEPFGPDEWSRPVYPGYDPKLGAGAVDKYEPRPAGASMFRSDQRQLKRDLASLELAIDQMEMKIGGNRVKMGYWNGVDFGISGLGDVMESYVASQYGDLHNGGHTIIAKLAKTGAEGVMSTASVAMRDPLFARWHKFIDDVFQRYKRKLGFYQDSDLDFPGVKLTGLTIQSEYLSVKNELMTYFNHAAAIKLNSLDFLTDSTNSILLRYTRLDHAPFTYRISVHSTQRSKGMIRIFLIPASVKKTVHMDITQLIIEMDRFHVSLTQGENTFTRKSTESPFFAKQRPSLKELQEKLRTSQMSEDEFNWAGCGWPREMTLPRGKEEGMGFEFLAVLSPLLDSDHFGTDWTDLSRRSWSWCGMRTDMGGMPDSRPMGFPFDRPPPLNDWKSLLRKADGTPRSNFLHQNVTITFTPDPWGLAKEDKLRV